MKRGMPGCDFDRHCVTSEERGEDERGEQGLVTEVVSKQGTCEFRVTMLDTVAGVINCGILASACDSGVNGGFTGVDSCKAGLVRDVWDSGVSPSWGPSVDGTGMVETSHGV